MDPEIHNIIEAEKDRHLREELRLHPKRAVTSTILPETQNCLRRILEAHGNSKAGI